MHQHAFPLTLAIAHKRVWEGVCVVPLFLKTNRASRLATHTSAEVVNGVMPRVEKVDSEIQNNSQDLCVWGH